MGDKDVKGKVMSNTNIIITQIVSRIIIEPAKKHPVIAKILGGIAIFGTCIGMWNGFNALSDHFANVVYSDKIYLSLWETGKKVPITDLVSTIPPVTPIKINEPVTLRFILTQANTNSPQITAILLTFPNDAKVTPIPYNGWSWERNNDVVNRYFLNFTTSQVLAKGLDSNLPALNVIFNKVGRIPFNYRIVGNKINPIERYFSIDTTRTYDDWLTKKQTFLPYDTNAPMVSGNNYNSATPQTVATTSFGVVSISTVTPDAKVSTEQKAKE